MAEQLICNQQVVGSTPITSSKNAKKAAAFFASYGGIPERPKGADCKSVVTDFGGPNPPSPTRKKKSRQRLFLFILFTILSSLFTLLSAPHATFSGEKIREFSPRISPHQRRDFIKKR